MANTLLLYSSVYGQTRRITERIREHLEAAGETAEAVPLADAPDPSGYARIVIGASIRNGKHHPAVHRFIEQHRATLEAVPAAFFSVNLVARKPEKNTPETNPYVTKFIEQCPWKPDLVGVFAGDLDYPKYGFFDRNIIRFIMWMTKGPTDPNTQKEFTDWNEVERFAARLVELRRQRAA